MNINRQNYEVFFIDYFDGKLTVDQVAELMHFISLYPDLEEEFNSFENLALPIAEIEFRDKNSLKDISKKTFFITDDTFETSCIAYIEGDLNAEENKVFEQDLVTNPEHYKTYKLFAQTKLQPELEISFENKNSLKQFEIKKNFNRIIFASISAAASIIIIFFFYFLTSKTSDVLPKYAERKSTKNTPLIDTNTNIAQQKTLPVQLKTIHQKRTDKIQMANSNTNNNAIANNQKPIEKDSAKQEQIVYAKEDLIAHIENRKLVALAIETPKYNTITIDYAQYKIRKKKEVPQNLAQVFKSKMQKAIRGENANPNQKFGFVDVADAFVRGVNKITGKKMKLEKTYDSKGDIETLAFYSDNIKVYKGGKK